MDIKINGVELNWMMKVITRFIDSKVNATAGVQITHEDSKLKIRGRSSTAMAEVSVPLLGGDGESFCVNGEMFAKLVGMNSREVSVTTDEKNCMMKGVGRARVPLLGSKVPEFEQVGGKCVMVAADELVGCYQKVSYAISNEETRPVLTGVLVECDGTRMRMVALDGFRMSIEEVPCEGDSVTMIILRTFMDAVTRSLPKDGDVSIHTDGHLICFDTDGLTMKAGLMSGEYIDYAKLVPERFRTESRVNVEEIRNALKAGSLISSNQDLVKMRVGENSIVVMKNSEEADYEADVSCATQGDGLQIAFNNRYLMDSIGAIDTEYAVMKFNSAVSPVIITDEDGHGVRLCLPVRVMGQ